MNQSETGMRGRTSGWKSALKAAAVVGIVSALFFALWEHGTPSEGSSDWLASGNGRIEATQIDVATKLPGRIAEIRVNEGDFVEAGQVVAKMQTDDLEAQRHEAVAQLAQAKAAVAGAEAQVALRKSDIATAQAAVAGRKSELSAAESRYVRFKKLVEEAVISQQEFDDVAARYHALSAAVVAAQSQVTAAMAAQTAAKAQVAGAESGVAAVEAAIARIDSNLEDSILKAPKGGRVQYRIAQPGEVLGGGGKVLNLVDLSDVYMTFFLPEQVAGRIAMGQEVRIILDATPDIVLPAQVSYVSSVAQFTPKTVETESERQKLMFRIKARVAPEVLQRDPEAVKTGLPGVAWVLLDPQKEWPENLEIRGAQ